MNTITIISGSTLGSAEYVAEHLADLLKAENIPVKVLHGPEWHELSVEDAWLIITSTHGAGELPDNLQPFLEQLVDKKPDLSNLYYGAIGLGSKEYDTFCGAIINIDDQLTKLGATRLGELLKIDVTEHDIPEDPAQLWLVSWLESYKQPRVQKQNT